MKTHIVSPPYLLWAIRDHVRRKEQEQQVVTPEGNSEDFDILAGVLQGDRHPRPLSLRHNPGLHTLESHQWMACNTKEVETTPTVGLTDLDYVEDTS